MMYPSEMANKALDILTTMGSTWMDTSLLRVKMGLTVSDQADLRKVMDRLRAAGKVDRTGDGKFKWRPLVKTWDKEFPFKFEVGAPGPEKPKKPLYYTHSKLPKIHSHTVSPDEDLPSKVMKDLDEPTEEMIPMAEFLKMKEELEGRVKKVEDELDEVKNVQVSHVKVLKIEKYDGTVKKLKDKVLPKVFSRVLALAKCRRNILLVGPAGCGKTYLGQLVADALDMDFSTLSCTSGMSEAHLVGRAVPDLTHGKNRFESTEFLERYEGGGIHLLDEFDAGDPNLYLVINTALSNNYLNIPNRKDNPKAKRHKDFVCIATANTFGRGATRMYAGRNQLDEATLDRFRIGIVECDYDQAVEVAVCPDKELRERCQKIRERIRDSGLRRIMSTRFMLDAHIMVENGDMTVDEAIEVFFEGWSREEKEKVTS